MTDLHFVKALGICRALSIHGFVGSCLRWWRRWYALRLCRSVDPGLGFFLTMSADKFQGFNDWGEEEGEKEEIGVGLEVGEGSCELCPESA